MKLYLFYRMLRILAAFIIVFFIGCRQQQMSLADLEKAEWENLAPGIDYFSTAQAKNRSNDSFELKLIHIKGVKTDTIAPELALGVILVTQQVEKYLRGSKSGYVRISPGEMIEAARLHFTIYLQHDYRDRKLFAMDSLRLKGLNGVVRVSYISKEDAATNQNNQSTDTTQTKVLDAKPLPASINIDLDDKAWSDVSLEEVKNSIQSRISIPVADISFPMPQIKPDVYAYYEYKVKR
jgi:hypothetical protein